MDNNINMVTEEAINKCSEYIDKSKKDQFLKVMKETKIISDEPTFEDSIDGKSIRANYIININRTNKQTLKFQCITDTPVDFSKTPIDFSANSDNTDPITETYDIVERDKPRLCDILGLLKRIYFMPEDFSYKTVIEQIHKLREMFSKEDILTFPSIAPPSNMGLIPA
jgi:hypothetical protein